MTFTVLLDGDLVVWLDSLAERERIGLLGAVELLRERGPHLGRPYVDTVKGSAFPNMKELRVQIGGEPWRVLFAFDPERSAILLVGGSKAGDKRWYKVHIPIADERFRRHLDELKRRE